MDKADEDELVKEGLMDKLTDPDYIDLKAQVEYQRLLDSPDELEALADRLEIPEDGTLTQEDIWEEAYRLLHPDSSTDDRD